MVLERASGYLVALFESLPRCQADPVSSLLHACLTERRGSALTLCLLKVHVVTRGVHGDPNATKEDAAMLLQRCRDTSAFCNFHGRNRITLRTQPRCDRGFGCSVSVCFGF